MRMIDGKPEYKNGLVRQWGWGLWEGREGTGEAGHGLGSQVLAPMPCLPVQDVLVKVVRYEGFFSLWKGFTPYYARLGPHTVLTFIFLEQMNKAYKRVFLSG